MARALCEFAAAEKTPLSVLGCAGERLCPAVRCREQHQRLDSAAGPGLVGPVGRLAVPAAAHLALVVDAVRFLRPVARLAGLPGPGHDLDHYRVVLVAAPGHLVHGLARFQRLPVVHPGRSGHGLDHFRHLVVAIGHFLVRHPDQRLAGGPALDDLLPALFPRHPPPALHHYLR